MEKALKELVRHLLRHPETTEWSIQGLGMLRTYLGQEKDRVIRVNIWDNNYRLPNVAPIHDHPWDFISWVSSRPGAGRGASEAATRQLMLPDEPTPSAPIPGGPLLRISSGSAPWRAG